MLQSDITHVSDKSIPIQDIVSTDGNAYHQTTAAGQSFRKKQESLAY